MFLIAYLITIHMGKSSDGWFASWPILTILLDVTLVLVFTLQQISFPAWIEYTFIPPLLLSRPWTVLTAIFLHLDLEHFGLNLLGLSLIGQDIERMTNCKKDLLVIFLLSGIVGHLLLVPLAPSHICYLGASNAILGLYGAGLVIEFTCGALSDALFWGGWFLLIDLIDSRGLHLIGFTTGVLYGVLRRKELCELKI